MSSAEQVVHVDDAMRIFEEIRQELLKEGLHQTENLNYLG